MLAKARAMYDEVDVYTREDLGKALDWARDKLMRKEGEGHVFQVTTSFHRGEVVCTFSKPEWGGEHSGTSMDMASEAVILATCEYLVGG